MASRIVDSEFLELYRQALANYEDDLVGSLRFGTWGVLLTKLKPSALTEREWKEIQCSDKKELARRIVSLIRSKDTLSNYIGFSRALCDSTTFDRDRIFPFIPELEKSGRHPPVKRRGLFMT